MAKYRQVHVEFWQDGFVLDLTPEEKYFYIYLMTNSKTSQCGIYELPKRIIETETGYNRETVEKLLARFEEYGKIKYNEGTKEIFMTNWAKYNWINSTKVIKCIEKELDNVKYQGFVKEFIYLINELGYRIDTLSIDLGEEREKEVEEEEEKEVEGEEVKQSAPNAADFYQENFGVLNPFIGESIEYWEKDLDSEMIIEAMKRALKQQKKWSYAEGILKDWVNKNVRTMKDVIALDKEFESRGNNLKRFGGKAIRTEEKPDWLDKEEDPKPQREYTPEEIAAFEEEKRKMQERIKNRNKSELALRGSASTEKGE
ncbi:DnaD domain-containing protein [Metabacillus bambusae]|uniref:DnaD domain protein n=1 Tax=Metabacillus bambusae TaxID=2795218 RepID=A0ABS3N4T5_9BACI|nr:DnaD domain protein [Metabacillus bambusae]MBO1513229.1 DnaD domain protein [Metabacillus bambusae]